MAEIFNGGVLISNGFDLSCYFRSVEANAETDMHDATTLCADGNRIFKPGLTERGISAEGFWAYDEATDSNSLDKHFHDALDADAENIITYSAGTGVGSAVQMLNTKLASYNIQETVGDLVIINFEAKATKTANNGFGRTVNGRLLMYQEVTGVVDGETFDAGSPAIDSGTGYVAQAHVSDGDFTSLTVKIQHSVDGNTWADLETISFTEEGGEQRVATSGAINRYRRAIVSAFSGTSAKVTVAFARGQN